jgi:hypothetical protein
MNTFAGATTSGQYLRGNGTNVVMASIVAGDVPTLNQNTTGSSGSCTGNAATATTAGTANALNTANSYTATGFTVATGAPYLFVNRTSSASGQMGIQFQNAGTSLWWNYIEASATTMNWYNSAGGTTALTLTTGGALTATGTVAGTNITSGGNVTGSSTSCSGNAATATTATNVSGGSVSATTGTFSGDIVRNNISSGQIYLTGSLPGYAANTYPTLRSDGADLYFACGGVYSGYFSGLNFVSRGNVTAYSDERKKKNWRSVADNFVEKLAEVKSGVYERTDEDITQVGVSAQSFQTLLPEAVLTDNDGFLSVAYGNAALASAVELAKELVALKELVKELKAEVDELKKAK